MLVPTRPLRLVLVCAAISLNACTPAAPAASEPAEPAEPAAAEITVEPNLPESPLTGCAGVGIGLDLGALPVGSSAASIDSYTRSRAQEFTALAPEGVTVEVGFYPGVSTFDATLHAVSNDRAVLHCSEMANVFIPTVPGRPGSRESGGSIISACAPCPDPDQ